MTSETRCDAMCQVIPGVWKRCIRGSGHLSELHIWVEALNRSGGHPQLMQWRDMDADEPDIVCDVIVTARHAAAPEPSGASE